MSYRAAKKAIDVLAKRREAGSLGNRLPATGVTYDSIIAAAEAAFYDSPSSFNSQEVRVITLLGSDHEKYWRLVMENPHTTPAERARIEQSIVPAMGSMLFLVDEDVVDGLCKAFPQYAAIFPSFAVQGVGMASMAAWTAICAMDKSLGAISSCFGAPLSPTEEEVERAKEQVAKLKRRNNAAAAAAVRNPAFPAEMAVPATWTLQAELVFGSVEKNACEVPPVEDSQRCMVFSDRYTSMKVRA